MRITADELEEMRGEEWNTRRREIEGVLLEAARLLIEHTRATRIELGPEEDDPETGALGWKVIIQVSSAQPTNVNEIPSTNTIQ